ncbi:hypothetical protein J4X53_25440, partial [Escherichia coli]
DWHPAMRLIVDVCREYGIPTILIPIEPVFHDKRTYYIDSVSHSSTFPFNIAQNSRSWDNIKGIDNFARNNPDVYRKIIARSLMGIYNKIKGFIFTQDWHPAMRLIVDVCREYGIPTILIPIEPVFHDKRTYYIDSVSH